MNLNAYDDMMGLEFGEYEGLEGIFDPQMLKEALVATAAGGAALLLATWGVKQVADKVGVAKIENPLLRTTVVSAATALAGFAVGRKVMEYNPNIGYGIVGGVGALAMANLIDAAMSQFTGNPRMITSLGETDYMSGTNGDDGMSALAALEATAVDATPGAFQGFADPTVTREALMGLEAATVQTETLGEYAPYLS